MTSKNHINLGRITALTSFLLGSIILILYYLTSDLFLLFVGYGFIALFGLINLGILIAILIRGAKDKVNRNQLLGTCGIMLLNFPVLLAYVWVALLLLGHMRITFTNETGAEITDLNINGCGGGHIENLKVGESETIWVEIIGDCAISIDYLSFGKREEETVASYVTSSMGQKVNHKIDGQDKDIF